MQKTHRFNSIKDASMAADVDTRIPSALPDELISLAFSPISRGQQFGPAGVGHYQLKAREYVEGCASGDRTNDWRLLLESSTVRKYMDTLGSNVVQFFACPRGCSGHI